MAGLYAGLDVSRKTTAICIVDAKGALILETETQTTPDAIATALKPYRRQLKCVGQESGNIAPWLEAGLAKAKFPMVCLDPMKAHASLKTRLNKTDANDARGLALLLAGGIYGKAYIKSIEAIRIRAVLVLRESIIHKARDLESAIDMTERRLVVEKKPKTRRPLLTESQHALKQAFASAKLSASTLLAERDKLNKVVEALARDNAVCQRLMTIPGVGPITALTFVSAVDDPKRFKSSRDVGPYFGLTPRTYQSGESTRSGGISHRGDAGVRKALYAAAFSLVTRSGTDCPLRSWGRKMARGKGTKIAYIAVARKLAVLMHHLWVTGQEFDSGR